MIVLSNLKIISQTPHVEGFQSLGISRVKVQMHDAFYRIFMARIWHML